MGIQPCSPELVESVRHDYEETDEPVASIAARHGIHRRTVSRLAERHGWRRRGRAGLQPALTAEGAACRAPTDGGGDVRAGLKFLLPDDAGEVGAAPPKPAARERPSKADWLERRIEAQLAQVERMQAQASPQSASEAAEITRLLERLADALLKVRRVRALEPRKARTDDGDDMPRDRDEFRRALARRIDAFVRSRTDGCVPAAGDACGPA